MRPKIEGLTWLSILELVEEIMINIFMAIGRLGDRIP